MRRGRARRATTACYGILVGGGDTLVMSNSAVVAGGAVPINGCQGGIGIQVGMAWTTPVERGHLTLTNVTVCGLPEERHHRRRRGLDGAHQVRHRDGRGADHPDRTERDPGLERRLRERSRTPRSRATSATSRRAGRTPSPTTRRRASCSTARRPARRSPPATIRHNDIGMYVASIRHDALAERRDLAQVLDRVEQPLRGRRLGPGPHPPRERRTSRAAASASWRCSTRARRTATSARSRAAGSQGSSAAAVQIRVGPTRRPATSPARSRSGRPSIHGPILSNSSSYTVTFGH